MDNFVKIVKPNKIEVISLDACRKFTIFKDSADKTNIKLIYNDNEDYVFDSSHLDFDKIMDYLEYRFWISPRDIERLELSE